MKRKLLYIFLVFFLLSGCSSENIDKTIDNENLNKVNSEENSIQNDNLNINDSEYGDVQNDNLNINDSEYGDVQNDNLSDIDESNFYVIGAQKFKEMVNSNQKYLFFIGRDTCPACKQFKQIASSFSSKEKINIYYVNTTDFNQNEWNTVTEIVDISYIPTIIVSYNSKILYNEYGVHQYDKLKNLVDEYSLK